MAHKIADKVAQLVAEYRNADTNIQNVYYIHNPSGWNAAELAVLVDNFQTWELGTASDLRSSQIALTRVTATDLTSLTGARVDKQLTAPIDGGLASEMLPANVTWALKKSIGERGRGRNGRTFWAGLGESQVVQDLIDNVAATAIQAAMEALLTDMVSSLTGAQVGVIHKPAAGTEDPYTFTAQLSYAATDFLIDSMRDRLPGHKRHKRRPVA